MSYTPVYLKKKTFFCGDFMCRDSLQISSPLSRLDRKAHVEESRACVLEKKMTFFFGVT